MEYGFSTTGRGSAKQATILPRVKAEPAATSQCDCPLPTDVVSLRHDVFTDGFRCYQRLEITVLQGLQVLLGNWFVYFQPARQQTDMVTMNESVSQ